MGIPIIIGTAEAQGAEVAQGEAEILPFVQGLVHAERFNVPRLSDPVSNSEGRICMHGEMICHCRLSPGFA